MKQLQQLRKLAEAYLEATSGYVKEAAETFFKEMDIDGNGVVDRTEFMEFMRIASIETEYKSLSLFESLCKINQTKQCFRTKDRYCTNNYGGPLVINVPAQPTTYNYYGPALPPTAGYGSSLAIVPAQPTPSYYGPALPPTVGYGSGLASVPAQPTPSYYGPTLPPTVGYGSGLASVPAQPTPSYYDGPTLPPTVDHGCLAIVPAGPANLVYI
ncbi:hypothetical protein COLO4_15985 [Corchorus olitorius]|uniref:EF-hand domain-containing protein n=1 Tax=Corchorus olitorius TaxID=93759 RepID=A0A1R3JKI3_9ROSI|nr:hypothetical protein COLO4_15985 [Corchorus olitorius]